MANGSGALESPAAESTLAVVLGASEYPRKPAWTNPVLGASARAVRDYLVSPSGLAMRPDQLLDLFDAAGGPPEQLLQVAEFLTTAGARARDLIVYYVGHGCFDHDDYCLGIRATERDREYISTIESRKLARIVREGFARKRVYVILDCCFAASAARDWQGDEIEVAVRKMSQPLPREGTAFLAAASKYDVARAPREERYTVFTGAVLEALTAGVDGAQPRLSLYDVYAEVRDRLQRRVIDSEAKPELHAPSQQAGDVSRLALFPNPAYLRRLEAERARAEAEAVARRNAEAARARAAEAERARAKAEEVARAKAAAEAARRRAAEAERARVEAEAIARTNAEAEAERARAAEAKRARAKAEEVARAKAEAEAEAEWIRLAAAERARVEAEAVERANSEAKAIRMRATRAEEAGGRAVEAKPVNVVVTHEAIPKPVPVVRSRRVTPEWRPAMTGGRPRTPDIPDRVVREAEHGRTVSEAPARVSTEAERARTAESRGKMAQSPVERLRAAPPRSPPAAAPGTGSPTLASEAAGRDAAPAAISTFSAASQEPHPNPSPELPVAEAPSESTLRIQRARLSARLWWARVVVGVVGIGAGTAIAYRACNGDPPQAPARDAGEDQRATVPARDAWADVRTTPAAPDVSPSVEKPPDCREGMVRVPAGTFQMGSPAGKGDADEHPQHAVPLSAYCIDRTEVTVQAYAACVKAKGCSPALRTVQWSGFSLDDVKRFSRFCNGEDRADHPVNCIDWTQATAYCRWAGKRLPTEAEWEYAARGTDGRTYPWGNEPPTEKRLNACGSECVAMVRRVLHEDWAQMKTYSARDEWETTSPVGSFPDGASPSGALDMAGNVWEWTEDRYGDYGQAPETNPHGAKTGTSRVVRGGGWHNIDVDLVRAAYRYGSGASFRYLDVGFRCARGD